MRAIIADDEPLLRYHLDQMLADFYPELEIIGKAVDGEEALNLCLNKKPDVVFLDIRMPGLDGLAVADALKKSDKQPIVVFVTAYDEYAVKAFEHEAADYLLKPIDEKRLAQACERIRQRLKEREESGVTAGPDIEIILKQLSTSLPEYLHWIRASKGEDIYLIASDEVSAFVAEDKYTTVYSEQGQHIIRTPLKELLSQLNPDLFWQVHRSTIVNVKRIQKISRGFTGGVTVVMNDGRHYTVSRRAASMFKSM
ncbi:LytTR family DNA-binding domain-containing protein [Microbulbifer sp. VAAF005]|uniref:LytR/AlgR family response regulator transcription factor n=1 Tax=Microbulbifer sp. VAAF005 TaxID=3034230 RepID=UPI0024ADA047|nr:LytTR family DNA-binding domain-containing protein [Microbulbifer sp. VAAF005]WHI47972.1 LytTR family DNA-binding domain-containing protein [Microbulbifer sp. VAAF005]